MDNYSGPELGQLMREHKITNPDTDNEVSEPVQFNLMFASSIGPTGQHPGYVFIISLSVALMLSAGIQFPASGNCARPLFELLASS